MFHYCHVRTLSLHLFLGIRRRKDEIHPLGDFPGGANYVQLGLWIRDIIGTTTVGMVEQLQRILCEGFVGILPATTASAGSGTSGDDGPGIQTPPLGSGDNQPEGRKFTLFPWKNGTMGRVPEHFEFPTCITVMQLWPFWYLGTDTYPPFKLLSKSDFTNSNLHKTFSVIGKLMKQMSDLAVADKVVSLECLRNQTQGNCIPTGTKVFDHWLDVNKYDKHVWCGYKLATVAKKHQSTTKANK